MNDEWKANSQDSDMDLLKKTTNRFKADLLDRNNESMASGDAYLETIDRTKLDFDFEKVCSVTMAKHNVYCCLVCGKYFQGKGTSSVAYAHSIEQDHHVFINMSTLQVWILPDLYSIQTKALDDIKYAIRPLYSKELIRFLNENTKPSYSVNDEAYIPGLVGFNNIKANDYENVILMAFSHVTPLRNFMLLLDNTNSTSNLVDQFSTLVKKIWNPRALKTHVSPLEICSAISSLSDKRFESSKQGDPLEFAIWFLNKLASDLKNTSPIISLTFRGKLIQNTQNIKSDKDEVSKQTKFISDGLDTSKQIPFLFLALDLPPAPLFLEGNDNNNIPQVSLLELLKKYDGNTIQELGSQRKKYLITSLPRYLILYYKRFEKNIQGEKEHNPTIVTFPLTGLDLREFCQHNQQESTFFDLCANIVHEPVMLGDQEKSIYMIHLEQNATGEWYEIQDLYIQKIRKDMITLKESYIQIWKRRNK